MFLIFSGVKSEDKRGGGGKGNWGTMDDEMKAKVSFKRVSPCILLDFFHLMMC